MPTTVYAWPPVGVTGSEWTELAPVNVSRDIFTGDEMLSAAQRKRRLATLTVSALAAGRNGAGYMEMLKRLTAGGEALVRLRSHPVNWHVDAALEEAERQSVPILKTSDGVDWDWDDAGVPLLLYEGRVLEGVPVMDGIWDAIRVTGLPPSTRVARPGEFLAVYADDTDVTGEVVQVLAPAVSSAAGVATIRLFSPVSAGGRVNIGVSDTGVFRQLETPRAVQPVGGDWSYTWSFREVFADETGGFVERDPWS